ncbi:MAG: ROK family protein [Anaerolineales bacterium]
MTTLFEYSIGIDVGGTSLRVALLRAGEGRILVERQALTLSEEGHEAVLARLAGLVREVISAAGALPQQVGAIGLGLPGRLDPAAGVVKFLPNLAGNWVGVRAAETLSGMLDLPVHLINDARAMTFGEWKYGAGRGVETMVCFTLGTGIGGGVVVNGRMLTDADGAVGELGHQVVVADGLPCSCGGRGCLESYASGQAITAAGIRAVLLRWGTSIGKLADFDLNRISPKLIAQAAQAGDPFAQEIFAQAGLYLGIGISNVVLALHPQRVVIGGGLAQVGDLLLEPARQTLRERVHLMFVADIEIMPAQLGIDAGLIGAASWTEQR